MVRSSGLGFSIAITLSSIGAFAPGASLMPTTWTRRQLIDRALDKLGVLVHGQTVSDEMIAKVDVVLDPRMAELRTLELIDVTEPAVLGTASPPNGGEFPEEFCLTLADCLAWAAASGFNL